MRPWFSANQMRGACEASCLGSAMTFIRQPEAELRPTPRNEFSPLEAPTPLETTFNLLIPFII